MRLSKSAKELIVDQIMNDVPKIDYWAQAQKLIREHYVSKMPPAVKVLYDDEKLSQYLESEYISVTWYARHNGYRDAYMHMLGVKHNDKAAINALVKPLRDLNEKQSKDRDNLHDQLTASIFSCTTRKAVVERYPQFEKYLPPLPEQVKYLPAVVGLTDMLKEAGWVDTSVTTKEAE